MLLAFTSSRTTFRGGQVNSAVPFLRFEQALFGRPLRQQERLLHSEEVHRWLSKDLAVTSGVLLTVCGLGYSYQ
jgi:hypothetical protein